MPDLKDIVPTKLLWIDLEMTGLDPARDRILEVAAIITDFEFNELGRYEAQVAHDPDLIQALFDANPWYQEHLDNVKYFMSQLPQAKPEEQVERELCAFTESIFQGEAAIIAGNSIHNDRGFIKAWWRTFDSKLHYRMLDVSSFKIVMEAKYRLEFTKPIESHRALDDIKESMDELKFYLERFKV